VVELGKAKNLQLLERTQLAQITDEQILAATLGGKGAAARLKIGSLADLVAYAKARPGVLNWGSPGIGTGGHLVTEVLLKQTGIEAPAGHYTWADYSKFIVAVSGAAKTTAGGQKIYGGIDYSTTFWFFLQWLVQEGKTPFKDDGSFGFTQKDMKTFLTLASPEAIKNAVVAGLGVAIVSRLIIELELRTGVLGIVRLADLKIERPLHLQRVRGRSESPALAQFIKVLREKR